MRNYNLNHLQQLESEAIFVLRETAAQFERPGLLFSGGKDSIIMAYLASKAFAPAKIPFPFVHVDTGHNFPETIEFRDKFVEKHGVNLVVGLVQDSIDRGTATEETGARPPVEGCTGEDIHSEECVMRNLDVIVRKAGCSVIGGIRFEVRPVRSGGNKLDRRGAESSRREPAFFDQVG